MRILDVIATLDPDHGGPIHTALQLARIWREEGHTFDFVTLDSPDAPYLASHAIPVTALGKLGSKGMRGRPLRLSERFAYSPLLAPWLKQTAPTYDAILVHGLWNYSTLAARRALVGCATPYFVFPHGSLDPWFKSKYPFKTIAKSMLWRLNEGVLLNNAASVFFTTENERRLADGAFRPYRVNASVIGYGCADVIGNVDDHIAAFKELAPALSNRSYLLFLSRIHAKKGCDILIEAFARIASENSDIDLVMAGPDQTGWRAKLEAMAVDRGIQERVHWTGMLTGSAKWGAYLGCDAFILPSHSENFGIVVAEALACARPVLITDKVNLWCEVADAEAGLIEADTTDGIERLLRRFLGLSADERTSMAYRARSCYDKHFRIEAAAASMMIAMQYPGVAA